jgi:hypothetical protein
MTPKLPKLLETPNRALAQRLDWATAATEARRQRDTEVKAERTERKRQRRQELAWSPAHQSHPALAGPSGAAVAALAWYVGRRRSSRSRCASVPANSASSAPW